jgi:hypothetical protein
VLITMIATRALRPERGGSSRRLTEDMEAASLKCSAGPVAQVVRAHA